VEAARKIVRIQENLNSICAGLQFNTSTLLWSICGGVFFGSVDACVCGVRLLATI